VKTANLQAAPPMESQLYTRSEPAMLPHFPRLIYLALLEDGYTELQILGDLDISAAQLEDETYRLSIAQHERFILRLLELTNDPHFTLRLWKNYDPSSANIFLLAVANSGQIAKALHLVTRYSRIFTRTLSIRSFEIDEQVVMDIDPQLEHDGVIYFALINFVLFLDGFFGSVLEGNHLINRVEMSLPRPDGFDEIQGDIGVPVTFEHPQTRIYFNKEYLDQPMKQADPQTVRLLQEMCERQLEEADAESGLVGSVKSLLIDRIASPPKLDEAAKLLNMSSRGLRRKLEQSGTSYQKLLDALRCRIATRLLRDTGEPVSSIAYELGFDNPSDFGRAFKRWTGQSPSSVRQPPP
jgi:AraC-like DNA-binding protein